MTDRSFYDETSETVTLTAGESARVDAYMASGADISRSFAASLCDEGRVTVNGKTVRKNHRLSPGDVIEFTVPGPEPVEVLPEDIPLDIVYEDADIIVVDKPRGMVVHPAPGNRTGTLVGALLYHCGDSLSGINGVTRPGIVHRIDKDTKGLLMVAKNDLAHASLAEQIKEHSFDRKYHALLYGTPKEESGRIVSGIGRSPRDRKKMAAFPVGTPNTREAVTEYRVVSSCKEISYCEFTLFTGRTHQIRVHSLMMGHPVLGDPVYAEGRKSYGLSGQALTAYHIGFVHPRTGERMCFSCGDGEDMDGIREKYGL